MHSHAAVVHSLQERAPTMLRGKDGEVSLSWITSKRDVVRNCGITAALYNAHVRSWPRSEEGQGLLLKLRLVSGFCAHCWSCRSKALWV